MGAVSILSNSGMLQAVSSKPFRTQLREVSDTRRALTQSLGPFRIRYEKPTTLDVLETNRSEKTTGTKRVQDFIFRTTS